MATVGKVTRKVRGKTYAYHAVRFSDPGTGKEKTRYFGTAGEAKAERTKIEAAIGGGTYSGDSHNLLVRELVEKFRKADYFPKGEEPLRSTTVADYETALVERILPRWGSVRLADIRASGLEQWKKDMAGAGDGKSPIRKALIVLGRMYRFALRDHLVTHNPTVDVSKPTVRSRTGTDERLTTGQLVTLFDSLRESAEAKTADLRERMRQATDEKGRQALEERAQAAGRTHVAVRIGAGTGMREGEIFGLRWRDVDLKGRVIHVRGQFTHGEFVEHAKTDAGTRVVPIDGELAKVLTAWQLAQKPERKKPESLVVSTSTGGPISASNFLSREFYPALEAAKLPRVVFHSLRHTYKTMIVSTDCPPAVVHSILGHANFATTLKLYGGITEEALQNAGDKITAAFQPVPDKNRTNGEPFSSTTESKVLK